MSSDGGKRKRRENEELQDQDSTDDMGLKGIAESQKQVHKKVRCRQAEKKDDITVNSSEHLIAEKEKTTRKQNQRNQRHRDKEIPTGPISSLSGLSPQILAKCGDIKDSQIAGPSTRDPLYVPPTNAGLSSNESDSSESLTDYDEIDDDFSPHIAHFENNLPDTYSSYQQNSTAHKAFQRNFFGNDFGHVCDVCDLLHFKNDLRIVKNEDTTKNITFIRTLLTNVNVEQVKLCLKCFGRCKNNRVPRLSVYNGFKYPSIPENLKNNPLDLVTERLVAPRVPFTQIRRLRHTDGQYGTYGQVINVPLQVNTLVRSLPRSMDDDHTVNVHISKQEMYKSSYAAGLVNKRKMKAWLQYLKNTPLYTVYGIKVDDNFLNGQYDEQNEMISDEQDNAVSELIHIEEGLIAMQQTLLWKQETCFGLAPMDEHNPYRLFDPFDPFEEELCFPQIYLGLIRTFHNNLNVPPYWIIKSELRRSDRRGVTPQHLLYMAQKLMWLRIRQALCTPNKFIAKYTIVTNEKIDSDNLARDCIELNLVSLRTLPNSIYYWIERKYDLFAMIRQYGKPTVYFTIKANEIGWPSLLQILYKLKNNREISVEEVEALHFIEKCKLVNEDAVTCAIYFNKLIDTLIKILQHKCNSPFKKYRVLHYFKRIGFDRGSPRAYILAWLDNAPDDALGKDYDQAVDLIDCLISVSTEEAGDNIQLQTHKYHCTCCGEAAPKIVQQCKFQAPFLPIKKTMILTPWESTETRYHYKKKYTALRKKLKDYEYEDFEVFYKHNNIRSNQEYINIIRAGIKTPKVFPKRHPREIWHNTFNPFILNVSKSNTDFQFITDEHSCAKYVAEYVNKANGRVSNLRRKIIEIMDEHPELDAFEIGKHFSASLLNHTEITSQEAAWYLLGLPLSECSKHIVYIPTVWPVNRQTIKIKSRELRILYDKYTHMPKENWFGIYEQRPAHLETISLAQFVSNYHKNLKGEYIKLEEPRIIRYRNYNKNTFLNEYKREMVTLHVPFRNEAVEILQKKKFLGIYTARLRFILQNKQEFESNIDMERVLQVFRELSVDEVPGDFNNSEDEMADFDTNLVKEIKTEPIDENDRELCSNIASTSIENPGADANSFIKTEDSELSDECEVNRVLKMEIDIEYEGVQYVNRGKESVVDDNKLEVMKEVMRSTLKTQLEEDVNAVNIKTEEDSEKSIKTEPLDE